MQGAQLQVPVNEGDSTLLNTKEGQNTQLAFAQPTQADGLSL